MDKERSKKMNYSLSSIVDAVKKGRVYLVGNGGSYANAMHIQNDLESVGVRAHTLNPASLTRTANDKDYEYIFADWLSLHADPGDVLIALSGSGRSRNILAALAAGEMLGMKIFLITDYLKARDMQESEEDQVQLGHDIMRAIREGR